MSVLTLFSRGLMRFVTSGFRALRGEQFKDPLGYGAKSVTVDFTDERALQVATVWACHTLLVDTIAMLPLKLYRRMRDGAVPREEYDHPLVRILQRQANALMSSYDLHTANAFNLIAYGNIYCWIGRGQDGSVVDLFPLQASMIKTVLNESNEVVYEYESDRGTRRLDKSQVLHVRGFGYSGLQGLSTFGFMRRTLATAATMQDHSEKFFVNGARPSGVFTIDKVLKDEQREVVRKNFIEKIEGTDNAFRTLLLEAGMQYQKLGYSPEDMLLVEQFQFSAEELCRFFRIPPQLIGLKVEGTAYTGLEQLNRAFVSYTLAPILARIAHAMTSQLLTIEEQQRMFFAHDVSALELADTASLSTFYAQMTQNGIMDRNEVRAKFKMAPRDGADVLTAQTNLAPLDNLGAAQLRQVPSQSNSAGEPIKQAQPVYNVNINVPEFKIEPVPVYMAPQEPATVVVNPEVKVERPQEPRSIEKIVTPNADGSWTVKEKVL